METWVHLYPVIYSSGRTTHFRPTGMDEETFEEQLANKLAPAEEKVFNNIGRLVPIASETRVYPNNKEKDADVDENSKEY